MRKILFLASALAFLVVTTANAQTVVDPNLFVCATGPTCVAGGTGTGGDPNVIQGPTANITMGFEGNFTLNSPLYVIIGVPNGPLVSAPTITNLPAGDSVSLLNGPSGTAMQTAGGTDAYTSLGFPQGATGTASESFTNWSGFDAGLGITATGFTLYEYQVNLGASIGKGGLVSFTVNGAPSGSFVVGFAYGTTNGGKTAVFATPFTTSGVIVGEPRTVGLLGAGLVGLAGFLIPRRRKQVKA